MINNCEDAAAACGQTAGWEAGPDLGYVRNEAVFGNTNRHIYVVDASGIVGEKLGETGPYPTTERPWYSYPEGWSPET